MGESSAWLMAERGAKVLIADRNKEQAIAVAEDIGEAAEPFHVDVAQPDECEAMVAAALNLFGGLDIAVNSAGVVDGEGIPFIETTVEHWRRIHSINLDGVFYCMKAEIPPMLGAGRGSIVNIGRLHSVTGIAGAAAYTSSKHGVLGLTRAVCARRTAARAYGSTASVPATWTRPCPKGRLTGRVGSTRWKHVASLASIPRLGEAWEVAEMVAFLTSMQGAFAPAPGSAWTAATPRIEQASF